VGEDTKIQQSVVGRHVRIGKGCTILGSYLWDGCVVEDNARITSAIVCKGATVKAGATISEGAILSFGTVIGAGFAVPAHTAITLQQGGEDDDWGDSSAKKAATEGEEKWDEREVGAGGKGRVYVQDAGSNDESSDEEDDEDEPAQLKLVRFNSIAPPSAALHVKVHGDDDDDSDDVEEEDAEEEEEKDDEEEDNGGGNESGDEAGGEGGEGAKSERETNIPHFMREVGETLRRGVTEQLPVDNIVLEVASLKLSYDATLCEYAIAALQSFFDIAGVPAAGTLGGKAVVPSKKMVHGLLSVLRAWSLVLSKYAREAREQGFILKGLETVCVANDAVYLPLFQVV
jgi:translation initiation factor eIF-2B subunit epsilon